MEWVRILAYITGTVDQELLLRNEYLVTENRILRAQITKEYVSILTLCDRVSQMGFVEKSPDEIRSFL